MTDHIPTGGRRGPVTPTEHGVIVHGDNGDAWLPTHTIPALAVQLATVYGEQAAGNAHGGPAWWAEAMWHETGRHLEDIVHDDTGAPAWRARGLSLRERFDRSPAGTALSWALDRWADLRVRRGGTW